jgi:hypothetical protein
MSSSRNGNLLLKSETRGQYEIQEQKEVLVLYTSIYRPISSSGHVSHAAHLCELH